MRHRWGQGTSLTVMIAMAIIACRCPAAGGATMDAAALKARLLPSPLELTLSDGACMLKDCDPRVITPAGDEFGACREVLVDALEAAGAAPQVATDPTGERIQFTVGEGTEPPPLPDGTQNREAYALAIGPRGIAARAASPAGLLYAAHTLRQLVRTSGSDGRLPCLIVRDAPRFALRGIYIEGGQERFGRIVDAAYLCEQIRMLSELKMNALVIECYNLFPLPSFPACADEGTLSEEDCRLIVREARRWHVTLVPSIQTLGQASELVWNSPEGEPFRETTAPGMICPSAPDLYPFIKGIYRDLLTLFGDSPVIGIGCSEIDMQWQGRYCPRCAARFAAGESVRDLLLGHAAKLVGLVHELSQDLDRPVRPLMWGDEFYMYGPGKDWVGIDRIAQDTVMGFWKYWPDYDGISGLMERGYDVLGISALYNHCFYLADISPGDPPKAWAPMEHTGVVNIAGMVAEAERSRQTHPGREFMGVATASFSKHRLRAFDTLWYGFALNGSCVWGAPSATLETYQPAFTRAFVRHRYDCADDGATEALALAWEDLDRCKSGLELANQTIHDAVGVYDTQEPGYTGNTLAGALHHCRELIDADGVPLPKLADLRAKAEGISSQAAAIRASLDRLRSLVGRTDRLTELELAADQIAAHARREMLLVDTASALRRAPAIPRVEAQAMAGALAGRWQREKESLELTLTRLAPLYSRGDPCGIVSVLRDATGIQRHLSDLSQGETATTQVDVLLHESFERLDAERWIIRGEPELIDGRMHTRAPGGWENYCGITTRDPLKLDDERPLIVEFELTPVQMNVDSQLMGSGTEQGILDYRFCFYGRVDHFGNQTQSAVALTGPWLDPRAGWMSRSESPALEMGRTYRVRAEITRRTWRTVVRRTDETEWDVPLWDSTAAPMDEVDQARLLFADVEPPGATAASIWGPITISRVKQ